MAPRKEKPDKVSGDEAVDAILSYLRKQNRPYSASDISANLHNKVTKAAATKILKDLQDRNEIEGRVSGKQIVYHALQDVSSCLSTSDLTDLDSEISSLRDQTISLTIMIKELKQRLSSLMTTPSTTSLNKAVFDLDTEKAQLLQRLFPLREGTVKPVSMQEAGKVDAEMRILVEFEHKRKKIEHKMWMYLREVLPEGYEVAELRESLGLDE